MKSNLTNAIALVSIGFVLTTGCVAPNGTPDNTGTGALMGGTFGALVGAIADHAHPGTGALIGAAAGVIAGGLVGHLIDQQQRQRLQQQSPQTWSKLQNNDAVYANSPPPSTPPALAAPTPSAPAPSTPPAATAPQMQPFSVDDIKALTKAGVKPEAINKEIEISQSKFSPQDLDVAQQANPAVDPAVLECMKSHSS